MTDQVTFIRSQQGGYQAAWYYVPQEFSASYRGPFASEDEARADAEANGLLAGAIPDTSLPSPRAIKQACEKLAAAGVHDMDAVMVEAIRIEAEEMTRDH
jgi:hypothetical protein